MILCNILNKHLFLRLRYLKEINVKIIPVPRDCTSDQELLGSLKVSVEYLASGELRDFAAKATVSAGKVPMDCGLDLESAGW